MPTSQNHVLKCPLAPPTLRTTHPVSANQNCTSFRIVFKSLCKSVFQVLLEWGIFDDGDHQSIVVSEITPRLLFSDTFDHLQV